MCRTWGCIMGNKRETQVRFVMLMMEPHQATGRWVSIQMIMDRLEVSRATAYRCIQRGTEGGMPLVMDSDDPGFNQNFVPLGVRCNFVTAARGKDAQTNERRQIRVMAHKMLHKRVDGSTAAEPGKFRK